MRRVQESETATWWSNERRTRGANALLLLGALVKSGAQADVPIANARVADVAVRAGLEGEELDQALAYAGEQSWMEAGETGWMRVTEAGIAAGQGELQ
jgi:hypothetical protein